MRCFVDHCLSFSFWPLYCLSFYGFRFLLVFSNLSCPIDPFLSAIVLSVLLQFTNSAYHFDVARSLSFYVVCFKSLFVLFLLATVLSVLPRSTVSGIFKLFLSFCPLPLFFAIVLSVLLPFMAAAYPFGIFQQNIKSEVYQLYS